MCVVIEDGVVMCATEEVFSVYKQVKCVGTPASITLLAAALMASYSFYSIMRARG